MPLNYSGFFYLYQKKMESRENFLKEFRGNYFGEISSQTSADEYFQNQTLRPILKLQNNLLLAVLKKQYKDAIPSLESAITQDPENSYAYYYAGLAYSNTKRPDKMVESFNNFLRLEPNSPESAKVRSFLKSSR